MELRRQGPPVDGGEVISQCLVSGGGGPNGRLFTYSNRVLLFLPELAHAGACGEERRKERPLSAPVGQWR